jgi:Spy/CpxP family protein refolding chaperone
MKKVIFVLFSLLATGMWIPADAQMQGSMRQDTTIRWGMMHPGYMGNNWMWRNQQGYNYLGNGMMNGMQNWMPGMRYYNRHRLSSALDMLEPYMWIVDRLPGMQDELSLTQEQSGQIIDMQMDFLKQKIDMDAALNKGQINLRQLLKTGATADAIADELAKCNEMSTKIAISAYETALKMETVLNATQKQQLNDLLMENFPSNLMSGYMRNY